MRLDLLTGRANFKETGQVNKDEMDLAMMEDFRRRERLRLLRAGGYRGVGYERAVAALVGEFEANLRREYPAEVLRMYRDRIDPAVNGLVKDGGVYQLVGGAEGMPHEHGVRGGG